MPGKRKGDALTGGTGDVSPQYFSYAVTMTAANTAFELALPTPVPRNKVQGDMVTVMEVMKIFFDMPEADANPAAAGGLVQAIAQISTRTGIGIDFANPTVIAQCQKTIRGAFTAAGTYGTAYYDPYEFNTNDGAGHGLIIATDNVFTTVTTFNFVAVAAFRIKMMYRMKNITLAEYIGIVQSQQ